MRYLNDFLLISFYLIDLGNFICNGNNLFDIDWNFSDFSYDFFGWNLPRPNKFSIYRAGMFSFLTPNKKYDLNTNTNGEHRGFVLTGKYEKVFPLDIYPMELLKSILVKDIDQMEALGIYEVAPEDFALTEYVCVSKQDHQKIIRAGLDMMIKEVG